MMLSIFDMFSVGVGPSSSHTVGPMWAGKSFADALEEKGLMDSVARVHVTLYGSLSSTGKGHGTDRAVTAGLEGWDPETVDPSHVLTVLDECSRKGSLLLNFRHPVAFQRSDVEFDLWKTLTYHPNGMSLSAFNDADQRIYHDTVYSVGGGFIVHKSDLTDKSNLADKSDPMEADQETDEPDKINERPIPYPFDTASELVSLCHKEKKTIAQLVYANETTMRSAEDVDAYLRKIWLHMQDCVRNGCLSQATMLPGGLHVPRRAPKLYRHLARNERTRIFDGDAPERIQRPLTDAIRGDSVMEWVDLFALAVNEENAGGGRIVTAPTNGAAGIIPAVLHYYWYFIDGADEKEVADFLLTASAIGYLFKRNASISGAEVGCQGEVGSACSMAAAGLCAVLGGTPQQVENAAEIGIEHNLGLTCDPIGGLVQIPCIERNAMASNTAINAARMARLSDGSHIVSLDSAIETMKETGHDMMEKYRETSRGGLAAVVQC